MDLHAYQAIIDFERSAKHAALKKLAVAVEALKKIGDIERNQWECGCGIDADEALAKIEGGEG